MIPTTAGTGSEATPNSIVAVPEEQLKVGIVNPEMIADAVILDGNMIRRLPRKLQPLPASTRCATPLNATPPRRQIRSVTCSQCRHCGSSSGILKKPATTRMHWMQKENDAGRFLCRRRHHLFWDHGCACAVLPSGRAIPIPHGVANAIMLMPVMQFNKSCCIERFAEVYEAVGGTGARTAQKADWVIAKMDAMVQHLDIPTSLKPYGVTEADLPALVKAGMDVQRLLVNNPRTVTAADAEALYRAIL